MKQFLYGLLLLTSLTIPQTSTATIWSWIETLETCSSSFTYCYSYNFTIGDWDETDSTPNPCYGLNACTIFIGHRHDAAGTSGSRIARSWGAGGASGGNSWILTAETMGDLGKALKSRFSIPFSGTTRHSGNTIATEECVGFFYRAGGNAGSYDSDTNNSSFSGHPMLPGSVCGVAPAPSGTCDFTQQVLTLDHGVLARQELEGNEVTETVNLTCSLPMTLKLYIFDADKLELRSDGSLYSELYINDSTPGEDGLTIDVSDQTQVSVKSMLHTNGSVEAGEFSGSTVMMITVE